MDEAISQNRLTELRGLRGLTVEQLAVRVGVPAATIEDWESSDGIPRRYWEPLAGIMGVTVPWLLGVEATGARV